MPAGGTDGGTPPGMYTAERAAIDSKRLGLDACLPGCSKLSYLEERGLTPRPGVDLHAIFGVRGCFNALWTHRTAQQTLGRPLMDQASRARICGGSGWPGHYPRWQSHALGGSGTKGHYLLYIDRIAAAGTASGMAMLTHPCVRCVGNRPGQTKPRFVRQRFTDINT